MRIHVVDPPAYTPPYDHSLCQALSDTGITVELITGPFSYGATTSLGKHAGQRQCETASNYVTSARFYRTSTHFSGRKRQIARTASHIPDMLRYRKYADNIADIVHFQWLSIQQIDAMLLPRKSKLVLTAHDVLPREPRLGQLAGQRRLYKRMDAIIVHSEHGARRLRDEAEVDSKKIHVIPHGVFDRFTHYPNDAQLPPELDDPKRRSSTPVILFFGLIRPYKGLDLLIKAWERIDRESGEGVSTDESAQLWVVGMPRMDISELQAASSAGVSWVPRYVHGPELAAVFRRADAVVLPYREIDQSGVLFTALAFGKPTILADVGGFPEMAKTGVAEIFSAGDVDALTQAVSRMINDKAHRDLHAACVKKVASHDGPYSWNSIATQTLKVYEQLV